MNAVNVGLEACPGVHADGRLQIEQEGLAAADMLCLLPQVQQLTVERLLRTDERQGTVNSFAQISSDILAEV